MSEQPHEMVTRLERMGQQPRVHTRQLTWQERIERFKEFNDLRFEDDGKRIEE